MHNLKYEATRFRSHFGSSGIVPFRSVCGPAVTPTVVATSMEPGALALIADDTVLRIPHEAFSRERVRRAKPSLTTVHKKATEYIDSTAEQKVRLMVKWFNSWPSLCGAVAEELAARDQLAKDVQHRDVMRHAMREVRARERGLAWVAAWAAIGAIEDGPAAEPDGGPPVGGEESVAADDVDGEFGPTRMRQVPVAADDVDGEVGPKRMRSLFEDDGSEESDISTQHGGSSSSSSSPSSSALSPMTSMPRKWKLLEPKPRTDEQARTD